MNGDRAPQCREAFGKCAPESASGTGDQCGLAGQGPMPGRYIVIAHKISHRSFAKSIRTSLATIRFGIAGGDEFNDIVDFIVSSVSDVRITTINGKARVAVVGTGGTISSVGRDSLDFVRYGENSRSDQNGVSLDAFFQSTATGGPCSGAGARS